MIGLSISGLDDCLKDFKDYELEADKAIQKASDDTIKAIVTDAKRRIQGGTKDKSVEGKKGSMGRFLIKSIMRKKQYEKDKYERVAGTDVPYAPYVEFGTGEKVFTNMDFDDQAKEVAKQFKGKKKVPGMTGVSFLNWSAINQRSKFIDRVKNELAKIKK
jgi:hypothetical protein